MRRTRWLGGVKVLVAVGLLAAGLTAAAQPATPGADEQSLARHVLSRMAFGPRPGDVDRVVARGVDAWIAEQLDPSSIDVATLDAGMMEWAPSLFLSLNDTMKRYNPPYQRGESEETQQKRNQNRREVKRQLRDAVLYRAVASPRQFEEVMLNFWRNHFSIDQNKNDVAWMAPNFEARVLRKHAFGKFENMLIASARHPAMLVYLDNNISQKPLTEQQQRLVDRYGENDNVPRSIAALGRERGLNENYARELMELHTLGVDRRYRQRDVTALARVLTGWTAKLNHTDSGYLFREDVHDTEPKWLFGTRLRGAGERQGLEVVRGLARHKLTADFICRKLCVYLVGDDPPERLVKNVTRVFTRTKGDLPKVYEAIVTSRAFRDPAARGAKFKTPFEFVVSALRVTDAELTSADRTQSLLEEMGQPTYRCLDPDGFADTAEAWLDPGVLVHRWRFAWDLAHRDLRGVKLTDRAIGSETSATLTELAAMPLSEDTRAAVDEAASAGGNPARLAILLGSPEFQQQ